MRTILRDTLRVAVLLGGIAFMGLLAGCAGTSVVRGSLSTNVSALPPPHSIAVIVSDASPTPKKNSQMAGHEADVHSVETALKQDLDILLAHRNLTVVTDAATADLILHCQITRVRSGSQILRLLIGYGAGKAVLSVSTTLSEGLGSLGETLVSFSTNSTTGAGGGLVSGLPSAASATGTAVHMIGPVLGVTGTLRQGLAQESYQTTERIDDRLADYFTSQHWPYPRPAKGILTRLTGG